MFCYEYKKFQKFQKNSIELCWILWYISTKIFFGIYWAFVFFVLGNTTGCNDWKVLDPAILTSSQHYPLANMSTMRDYTNLHQQQQMQNGPSHLRSFDYNTNNAFSNAFTQLQPNINSFTQHLNTQQNHLNWFTSADLNSQISSPPGFRTNQTTKQQECWKCVFSLFIWIRQFSDKNIYIGK